MVTVERGVIEITLSQLQNLGHGKRVPPFLRPLGVEGLACQDRSLSFAIDSLN